MRRDRSALLSGVGVLLTGFVALLGAIGVAAHVISYGAARTFYGYFGLEPTVAAITPVNAAFSLHNTWLIVYLRLASDYSVIILVLGLVLASRALWRWLTESPASWVSQFRGRAAETRAGKRNRLSTTARRLRREARLAALDVAPRVRGWLVAVLVFVVAVQLYAASTNFSFFYLEITQAARERAMAVTREGGTEPVREKLDLPLDFDLAPPIATVRWTGRPEKLPFAMEPLKPFYTGRFMGVVNGQYVVYIYGAKDLAYLSPLDVSMSTFVIGM